jgi:hypothetical protein
VLIGVYLWLTFFGKNFFEWFNFVNFPHHGLVTWINWLELENAFACRAIIKSPRNSSVRGFPGVAVIGYDFGFDIIRERARARTLRLAVAAQKLSGTKATVTSN